MLVARPAHSPRNSTRRAQSGVVLIVALIMLIAMTLAGLALMRSVDTATIVAGNLSFQQAATHSGDIGVENAVTAIEAFITSSTSALDASIPGAGYVADGLAATQSRNAGESWDAYWTRKLDSRKVLALDDTTATHNKIYYVIDRLCTAAGAADTTICPPSSVVSTTPGAAAGTDEEGGAVGLATPTGAASSQVYYRITARVEGPRNTLSYVQAIIAK